MKLSAGLAALSLLFVFVANVEASSAHDAAAGMHHKGSGKGLGTIKPANHGRCNPVGATCLFNSAFVGCRDILTAVVCMQRKSRGLADPMAILTG